MILSVLTKQNNLHKTRHMHIVQSVTFHLAGLAKQINRKANEILQSANIHVRIDQVPVLMMIHYMGPLCQQELAKGLCRDKSSVQRTLVKLLEHKLVVVTKDHQDKRKNIIALSDKGKAIATSLEIKLLEMDQLLFNHINDQDQQRIIAMVRSLETRISSPNDPFNKLHLIFG